VSENYSRDELIKIVESFRASVFRIAYGYTGSYEDSEDISQDVFLRLYQSNKTFKNDEHMKAWLIRVTINASKGLMRTPWKKRKEILTLRDIEDRPYYDDVTERELFDCVMRLPENYRTVVCLYYYEDYSTKEIAKIMKISVTAVTTRLSRAREELKKTYTKFEREEIRHAKNGI
jgi:RNA polymerase sigma-70 factor (ECF subfamily)